MGAQLQDRWMREAACVARGSAGFFVVSRGCWGGGHANAGGQQQADAMFPAKPAARALASCEALTHMKPATTVQISHFAASSKSSRLVAAAQTVIVLHASLGTTQCSGEWDTRA